MKVTLIYTHFLALATIIYNLVLAPVAIRVALRIMGFLAHLSFKKAYLSNHYDKEDL